MKQKKRTVPKGRMTQAHISAIVAEIEAYGRGEREGALTWAQLENFAGYSHVALWQKEPIKAAFQRVKQEQRRQQTPNTSARRTTDERLIAMQHLVDELRETIRAYDERWVLCEYNMHRMGLDPSELRGPLDALDRVGIKRRPTNMRSVQR